MTSRKIKDRYLSQRIPDLKAETEALRVSDFVGTIENFAKEYLTGAMEIETEGSSDGAISISVAYTAYLLRSFLSSVRSDEMIYLKIAFDGALSLSVSFSSLPSAEELSEIITLARVAGWDVKRDGETLHFYAEVYDDRALQIYAVSIDDLMSEFKNIIFL